MTEQENYNDKLAYLRQYYDEVSTYDFYRDIFPEGSFERKGHQEDMKANGVLLTVKNERGRMYVVTDDLELLDEMNEKKLAGEDMVVMSPISYSGRSRTGDNARWLYALAIDLDYQNRARLEDVFHQMKNEVIPQATYVVHSGTGIHLYYVFEQAIPMYKHLQADFRQFKYELIDLVWNRYTSLRGEVKDKQRQGILQGFRIVGSGSKLGADYPVRAFLTGGKVTMEYLNGFVDEKYRVTNFNYQSKLSLHKAKELYPEWYQERIVDGRAKKRWRKSRAVYDWWLQTIRKEKSVGHRYYCIMCLAIYARICSVYDEKHNPNPVTYEELERDAYSLFEDFDSISKDDTNRFAKKDIRDALELFNENYVHYPRNEVERVTAIIIPVNKRNYQKQADHLEEARAVRDIRMKRQGRKWTDNNGRPSAADKVLHWQFDHPNGKKAECIRETGLSKPTVYKHWKHVEVYESEGRKRYAVDGHLTSRMISNELDEELRKSFAENGRGA